MNLFIVEDSVHIQNRLRAFVEELPDVHVVGIASEVNNAYRAIVAVNPDVLILDLQLGDGNGLTLLKSIKQNKPNIKVVVLTNHATEANRLHALRAGADNFLDKSTDFEQIACILRDWQSPSSISNPH